MPTGGEISTTKQEFYEISRFPNVLGAIDGTHVKIISPGGLRPEVWRNRKNYFSINVQGICDANLRFTNIIARWWGSAHDSRVFNDSPIKNELEQGMYLNSYLLGNNGYMPELSFNSGIKPTNRSRIEL